MAYKASEHVKDHIRRHEGFAADPYWDAKTGRMAVGYGDTDGDIRTVTQDEAEERLNKRIGMAEADLQKAVTRSDISQGQFDAMVDMHYNMGPGRIREFLDVVNSGDYDRAGKEILKYTKSRNSATGQLEELPGLVKRAQDRARMWGAPVQAEMADDFTFDGEDLPGQEFTFDDAPVEDPAAARAAGLSMASSIADPTEVKAKLEARNLADNLGITEDEATARLYESTPQDVELEIKAPAIAKYSPATADWAKNPENYALLKEKGAYPRKVEAAGRNVNLKDQSDFEVAYKNNKFILQEAALHAGMVSGVLSPEVGAKHLGEIDAQRAENQYTDNKVGIEKIKKELEDVGPAFTKLVKGASQYWNADRADWENLEEGMRGAYDGTIESLDAIVGVLKESIKNPKAATLLSAESMGTSVVPLGAGAAGFFTAGPLAGAGAAFASGGIIAFGSYMQDQLQPFRDPKTGKIDYQAAFSDANRVKQWRQEAAIYGGVMGLADMFYSGVAGKYVTKSVGKGAIGAVAGVAKEAAVGGATDSASEVTAQIGAALYGNKLTPEKLGEIAVEGVAEGVFSAGPGAAMGTVGAGVKHVLEKPRDAAIKTVAKVDEANKANKAVSGLSELRTTVQSDPAYQENPQQMSELIEESITPPPLPADTNPSMESEDAAVRSESKALDREAESTTINFSPSEFDKYHELAGRDPLETLRQLPLDVQQEYARNKSTDTSVLVPIAQWMRILEDDPAIDGIVRIQGNTLNAVEANETITGLEQDPLTLFQAKDEPPPVPGDVIDTPTDEVPEGIEIFEATGPDGNIISRPINLVHRFRGQRDQKVFSGILNRLKQATAHSDVAPGPEGLEALADLQYRRFKARADMLGTTVDALAARLRIGRSDRKMERRAHGAFISQQGFNPEAAYTVVFSSTADAATIVHEFGHQWLHEMAHDWDFIKQIPDENLTDQQREYKWAMTTAAELLNLREISDLQKLRGTERTIVHETFAQTSERYFLEGKFADSRIRQLLESFRKWMVELLHSIPGIGKAYESSGIGYLKITPQVERMFDAILGASAIVDEEVVPMFPEPLFDANMLGPDGKAYLETVRDARSEAIANTYGQAWNRTMKEQEKLIDANLNRIYDEAVADVDELPGIRMLNGIAKAFKEYQKGELDADPRFSFESVARMFFEGDVERMEEFRASLPTSLIASKKKGGMDAAQYMLVNQIHDPRVLMDLIRQAGRKEQLINQRIEEKIKTEMPVLKTEEEIHEIAVQAVNDKGREYLLMKEVQILATKYLPALKGVAEKLINPASYIAKIAKPKFEFDSLQMVLGARALKFNAGRYLRDSHRHGRQAARMFKASNIMEAFDAKYNEVLHFFAYRTAVAAQEGIAKTNTRIKNFIKYSVNRDASNLYDPDVMAYGRQVIQAIGAQAPMRLLTMEDVGVHSGLTTTMLSDINSAVTKFVMASGGRMGNDMTVGGYLQMGEMLRVIQRAARDAKEVELDGKRYNRDAVSSAIEADLQGGNVVSYLREPGVNVSAAAVRAEFVNVRSLFEGLYPSKEDFAKSALGRLFYTVVNAESVRNIEYARIMKKLGQAVKLFAGNDSIAKDVLGALFRRLPITRRFYSAKPIAWADGGMTFNNFGELMTAILLMGSQSGAKKFLIGHKISGINPATGLVDTTKWDKFLAEKIADGTIKEKHFKLAQVIWDIFEELHPLIKDAMRRSDGFNIGHIEGQTVKTPWGDFRGGYMPVSPKELLAPTKISYKLDPDTDGYRPSQLYPGMNTGMTNERSEDYYELNLDMGRVPAYISAALNIAYLRNPMLEFGKIIDDPRVTKQLETRRPGAYGDDKNGVLVPWYNRVKRQEYVEFSSGLADTLARTLRRRVNIATYLGSFMSPARQIFGLFPTASQIKPIHLIGAAARITAAPRAYGESIAAKSVYMENRMRSSQQDIVRSWDELDLNFDWIHWTNEKINTVTYIMIQTMQNYVDKITWQGAYSHARDKGLSEPDAINAANGVVEATQSSGNVSAMSNAQAGKDLKKLIAMVSSVPISMHNLMQVEAQRDQSATKKATALITLGLMATVIPTIVDALISEAFEGEDEGEEDKPEEMVADEKARMLFLKTAVGSLDTIIPMYLRPVTSTILFGEATISPALNKLNKLPSAYKGVVNATDGIDMTPKQVAALMDTFTIMTGLPASVIGKGILLDDALMEEDARVERDEIRRDQMQEAKDEELAQY